MSDEFGNDFVTITDDDGNEFELEHLDTVEIGGELYMAFLPTGLDESDEDYGLIILKGIVQDDEEILVTVDNEAELNAAFEQFILRLSDDIDD